MLNLIANMKIKMGLSVKAEFYTSEDPKGIKISDVEFAAINMVKDNFMVVGIIPSPSECNLCNCNN